MAHVRIPALEADVDGDGIAACEGDCDDADPEAFPGAPEQCNGRDDDCDGVIDEDADVDGDGDGVTPCGGDCNDLDPTIRPGAPERCNGIDDDCDGEADSNDCHGLAATPACSCRAPGSDGAMRVAAPVGILSLTSLLLLLLLRRRAR